MSSTRIDLLGEDPISLKAAAQLPAFQRDGKSRNPSTIWRYVRSGARSIDGKTVKLESIKQGGCFATSREAVTRFIARLNGEKPSLEPAPRRVLDIKQGLARHGISWEPKSAQAVQ